MYPALPAQSFDWTCLAEYQVAHPICFVTKGIDQKQATYSCEGIRVAELMDREK